MQEVSNGTPVTPQSTLTRKQIMLLRFNHRCGFCTSSNVNKDNGECRDCGTFSPGIRTPLKGGKKDGQWK